MKATFAGRLNEALKMKDMLPAELHRITKISEAQISAYRKGAYKASQRNIEKLANALDVSIPWLMGLIDDPDRISNAYPIETHKIPLVGEIACGEPILTEETFSHYVEAGSKIRADFCLRCSGDSMQNARIYDGDIVFIAKQPDVDNGEIAAVAIEDAITLKRVYKGPGYIELRAENPKYKPIIIREQDHKNVRIVGKAIAFQADVI